MGLNLHFQFPHSNRQVEQLFTRRHAMIKHGFNHGVINAEINIRAFQVSKGSLFFQSFNDIFELSIIGGFSFCIFVLDANYLLSAVFF
jgi:hypothetical protein